MSKPELEKLESVPLKTYWDSEAGEFTPWLAENIKLLCDALGLDGLEVEGTERSVGAFKADILCKDDQNNWVVIENQLTQTDHNHLGQILTYAAGLQASTVIWVAEHFRPEHRAALDWLNERAGEGAAFYGVEVELLRIGNSPPLAPRFNIVSEPNEFSIDARAGATSSISEQRLLEAGFWKNLREYLIERKSFIKPREPDPKSPGKNYSVAKLGGCNLAARWDEGELRVLVHSEGKYKQQYFDGLESDKGEIEQEIRQRCQEPLDWRPPDFGPQRHAARISVLLPADIDDKNKWPEYFKWLQTGLEAFYQVFQPRVQKISKELAQQEESD